MKRSAYILAIAFIFCVMIIANGTALQYTTTTIIVNQARSPPVLGSRSLVLSESCSTLDRTDNLGMPCSKNNFLAAEDPDAYSAQQSEIIDLSHNNSDRVEVRIVPNASKQSPGTALVLPKSSKIPPHLSYRASTVGARTSCALITDKCHFRLTGPHDNYWAFNCTNAFWGTSGKAPPTPFEPQVQDVPPLMTKPTDQLQFASFENANLTTVYNSQGANLTNGSLPRFPVAMPDSELINPVYMGIAARFVLGSQNPEADLSESPGFFNSNGGWYGFVLSCSYDVRKVQYTWSNGSIIDVEPSRSSNGILAEIYHGFHTPRDPGQLDYDLQDAMVQATMEDNVEALLKKWSDLLSIQIMSVIGAVLVSAPSISEQMRTPTLVARVAVPPIALLITACFTYATFGLVVVMMAWSAIKHNVRNLSSLISVEGLASHAFEQQPGSHAHLVTDELLTDGSGRRDGSYSTAPPRRDSAEPLRIGVERDGHRFRFKVWPTVAGCGRLEDESDHALTGDGAVSTPSATDQHLESGQNS